MRSNCQNYLIYTAPSAKNVFLSPYLSLMEPLSCCVACEGGQGSPGSYLGSLVEVLFGRYAAYPRPSILVARL